MSDQAVSQADAQAYYEDWSLKVGLRDWLAPNLRHEHLRVLVDDLMRNQTDRRILDIGCSTGVLTQHLTRYGNVTGTDFSTAAVRAAQERVPEATFHAGPLDTLPSGQPYDLITLFDVLEHIPATERPEFLVKLCGMLAPAGQIFASTPFPDYTAWKRKNGDEELQIIDEEVCLPDVIREAADAGLQLVAYKAYDVWGGSPEYQAMVFARAARPGDGVVRIEPRVRHHDARRWRIQQAARVALKGRLRMAWWFLTADVPTARS
jgi:SAM-dependent methyltransferase